MSKRISVITSAFNEEDCIEELAHRLKLVFDDHPQYAFEAVLVDNGSEDRTWERMKSIRNRDKRFRIVRLSRNFRMDGGLTAGLKFVTGEAAILMAADLQDPPELIGEFIKKWEEGFENVYMSVRQRHGIGPIRRMNSILFYKLANLLTHGRFPKNASDYRLVDRKVYQAVRGMEERNRFVRGLFGWVGFKSIGIEADRPTRFGGESNAHTFKVLDLAIKGIFAHSYLPLKAISVIGVTLSIGSILALVPLTLVWVINGVPFAGFGTLVSIVLLLFGALFLLLGIVAEYVGLIYEEVKQRPNFVVAEAHGIEGDA